MNFRFQLRQWHIYLLLWLWVFLYPVVSEFFKRDSEFEFSGILSIWFNLVPFVVLFLIHNCVLVPRFFHAHKSKSRYFLLVAVALVLFAVFQSFLFAPARRDDIMSRFDIFPRRPVEAAEHNFDADFPFPPPPDEMSAPPRPPFLEPIADTVIALLMIGCNLAVVLFFRMQQEQENARQLEKANLRHELEYLKAQINPHFLMNMLNNIHALVEVDPEKAQDMIIDLSKLMRYALYEGSNRTVPLSSEIDFVCNYLKLMRQRCSGRKVAIDQHMPPGVPENIRVPPLLFIVFIENAFKHGISYRQATYVDVGIDIEADKVHFVCRNSVPAAADKPASAGGIGLENARKRLDLLYGKNYSLDISNQASEYRVELTIPANEEKYTVFGG